MLEIAEEIARSISVHCENILHLLNMAYMAHHPSFLFKTHSRLTLGPITLQQNVWELTILFFPQTARKAPN